MLVGTAVMFLALTTSSRSSTLRDTASPVSNLGRWLETYLGDCDSSDPSFDKKGCDDKAASQQAKLNGKLLLLDIEPGEQLTFAEFEKAKSAFRLHLAPFFG